MKVTPVLLALWFVVAAVATPATAAISGQSASVSGQSASVSGQSVNVASDRSANGSGAPPDPKTDVIGWEDGYWYNESIDVDQSDGLSDAELEAYVARSMARVEYIRDREFKERVPVSVLSRAEYRNQSANQTRNGPYGAWNNQVWEALFVVGEQTDVQKELGSTVGSSVLGFYSPREDAIQIITDTPDSPTIDNATLVHELTHAMQDQYYNLSSPTYSAPTQDGDLATNGVVEGEANYVEERYRQHCQSDWECVATPSGDGGGGGPGPNPGILLTLLQPYSDGPVYVDHLRDRGGWDAVDAKFRHPPNSSEQIIHLTDDAPRPISYTDEATGGWRLFPSQGQNGSDTVGEASIYVMLWYQARTYGADTVNPRDLFDASGPYDLYDYESTPSSGWANDRVFPYHRGTGDGADYGYVWVTEWDTTRDAREFEQAYRAILAAHDARQRSDGVYVVRNDPWADAFRVVRNGTRVTVVNGPTPADVADIRPSLSPSATTTRSPTTTTAATTQSTTAATATTTTSATTTGEGSQTTTGAGNGAGIAAPGLGFATGVLALALAAVTLVLRRRER
ncbi:MAG: Hvo_1808 family surface protein [Haloferacaceae archaeon]